MRLGFFGPAGTFTHAALLASPRADGAEAVPFASERETILAAQSGTVDAALVPIENALEGGVNATLDTLIFDAPGVRIVGEEVLPISHALIATAMGLFAAIPAVVFYNSFNSKIRVLDSEMSNFSSDFLNIVKRHFFK